MDQNIKEKIKKLLALAGDKGATEDEAATAMRMASGLMARHGIAQKDLGGEASRAKIGKNIEAGFKPYHVELAASAASIFGCRIISYDRGKGGIVFIGRPDNTDAAEQTMFWLMRQMDSFYKHALPPGLSQRERSEFRRTFKAACARRVMQRAAQLVYDMKRNDNAAVAATGSTALVVAGYFDQMFKEAEEEMKKIPGLRQTTRKPLKAGSGTAAGMKAGDNVKLRQEVK